MNFLKKYAIKAKIFFLNYALPIMAVSGISLYVIGPHYQLVWAKDFGLTLITAGVFGVVLKSLQFIGVFDEAILSIVSKEEFIKKIIAILGNEDVKKNRANIFGYIEFKDAIDALNAKSNNPERASLRDLWNDLTKTIIATDFPELNDALASSLKESALLRPDFYYKEMDLIYSLEDFDANKAIIKICVTSILKIASNQGCDVPFKATFTNNSQKNKQNFSYCHAKLGNGECLDIMKEGCIEKTDNGSVLSYGFRGYSDYEISSKYYLDLSVNDSPYIIMGIARLTSLFKAKVENKIEKKFRVLIKEYGGGLNKFDIDSPIPYNNGAACDYSIKSKDLIFPGHGVIILLVRNDS